MHLSREEEENIRKEKYHELCKNIVSTFFSGDRIEFLNVGVNKSIRASVSQCLRKIHQNYTVSRYGEHFRTSIKTLIILRSR